MLVKLVLVTCLGVATARPKMRGGQELVLHTGGAAELIRSPPNASCTTIAITDSTTTPPDVVKDLFGKSTRDQWQVMATFEVTLEKRNTTITDRLSKLIPLVRQVGNSEQFAHVMYFTKYFSACLSHRTRIDDMGSYVPLTQMWIQMLMLE
ncbi:uncharacterized protein LOC135114401 [Scylla paramamosain]|uniref:uncharacterized protein LOC135114401 n=1 Tax=Scylla paramamosain TaxID=85552 RepID=UPI0030835A1D